MVTIMYLVLSGTMVVMIAMVDMLLRKQSIYLELMGVFSKNENMNIMLYLFFWVLGLLWGAVVDYRFRKAKRGS
ncbi:MAG: hypothetical protein K0Q90_2755 [Paenibacillaceae bacterium]|nr:hypothetical protein [Paenibacillaceae bacterium]